MEDKAALGNADAENKVRYEALPKQKRKEFRRAVSGEEVESAEWNTQLLYVEYEGEWYSVTVTIIQ